MKIKFLLLVTGLLSLTTIIAQVYPVRPQLSDKNSFSMILLPDPQSYNKFDANQPLFELQTAWIANSIEPLNIKGVLCTGDLVEQNEIRIPDGINGNQTSEEQWQAASRAFERLDDKISYVVHCVVVLLYGSVCPAAVPSVQSKFPYAVTTAITYFYFLFL